MTAYYNEIDPYAAQWLRNLIDAGHIAPGIVDERSIEDVRPSELAGYTQCHFFAGIGIWSYALRNAGWPDDRPVWTGSCPCPCQPFSAAGKGAGFDDERHLWPAWHHLIKESGPGVIFGEQVASKDGLGWLDLVQADLEAEGYACAPVDLCADSYRMDHCNAVRNIFKGIGMMRDIDEARIGLNDQDLHAYCDAWREWCRTRGFYMPPLAKNILARMQPSKVGQPPNAELMPDMPYFNMAVHALCEMKDNEAECFLLMYYCQVKNIKKVAYEMQIGRQTFYDRVNRFARRAYSMSLSIKKMTSDIPRIETAEAAID